jgi:hypothetical protein
MSLNNYGFDLYKELDPEPDFRILKSGCSQGALERNFSDNNFSSCVVISRNPFIIKKLFRNEIGRDKESVFYTVFETFETGLSEEDRIFLLFHCHLETC